MSKISFLMATDAAEMSDTRKKLLEEATIKLTRKFLEDALNKAIGKGQRSMKISFFDMLKEADSIGKADLWKQISSLVPPMMVELQKLGYEVSASRSDEHSYTVGW